MSPGSGSPGSANSGRAPGLDRVKAVLQYRASPGFRRDLLAAAEEWLELVIVDESDHETFAVEMADAHVLLHVLEPVTPEVIAGAPELRLIQKLGVGVNTIDLSAAAEHGVAVANMPGSNSQAVAEMALLLMLATLRLTVPVDREVRAGRGWELDPDLVDQMGELAGRTVGLVGYGAVPRVLAPMLVAVGAEVVHTTRTPKPDAIGTALGFAELLDASDVVSLHIPLNPQTSGIMDAAAFGRMRAGSILVNTARGGLVEEPALVEALRTGHLRGAGLDVFVNEPVPVSHELLALDNVVLSPHVSWLTPETLQRSIGIAIENCRRVRVGAPLVHQV